MFRKSIIFLFIISIAIFFSGCVSDWLYELPQDYAISNNAYTTIELVKITSRYGDACTLDIVIESYIHEFSYNEQYIAVKQFDPQKLDFENYNSNDFSAPMYYLVDTISTNVYGPYETQEKFDLLCKEINVGELGKWITTRSNPRR